MYNTRTPIQFILFSFPANNIICVHHGIHGGKGAEIYHPSTGAQRVGKPRETVLE